MSELKPWQQPPLNEWSICGMNHYHMNGEKFLFVSMVKDGVCITEEGKDDKYLWNRLWHKASNTRPAIKDRLVEAIQNKFDENYYQQNWKYRIDLYTLNEILEEVEKAINSILDE